MARKYCLVGAVDQRLLDFLFSADCEAVRVARGGSPTFPALGRHPTAHRIPQGARGESRRYQG